MEEQRLLNLPIDEVVPDVQQPRQSFPEDVEQRMADSIRARGVLQPIRIRRTERGWVIVSGEFRWRGAKRAGLKTLPCLVVNGEPSEMTILEDQIVENVARNDLRPLELARALARLKALKGCTAQQLAKELGISGAEVTRTESLLSLPDDIQALVDAGAVPEGIAYEISRLRDPLAQRDMAAAVKAKTMNRQAVTEAVRAKIGSKQTKSKDSRLASRLDGGISVTVSAGQALTRANLLAASNFLRKEAGKLPEAAAAPAEPSSSPATV